MASLLQKDERNPGRDTRPGFTRPWEPPATAGDPRDIDALRAQRAEVDAMLGFRHAENAHQKARAWWRLVQARQARRAIQPDGLPPLPAPPPGALTFAQKFLAKIGRFRPECATLPPHLR